MKLVLFFTTGNDCTWSADQVLPFEADSAEQAIVDFEKTCKEAFNSNNDDFIFYGLDLNYSDFYFYSYNESKNVFSMPNIYTLDEWFEQNKPKDKVDR